MYNQFSSVQSLSPVWLFAAPWTAARQTSLSITNSWSPPEPMSIESVMPSNDLILLSPSPPALNLSQHQGLFKWVSSSHQVAKVLEFSASTSVLPMNTQNWSPLGWTGLVSNFQLYKLFSLDFSGMFKMEYLRLLNDSSYEGWRMYTVFIL